MIDDAERAAMQQSARAAIAAALAADANADVDAVLDRLAWRETLQSEPGDAIAVVFGALGATGAASTALDDVLLFALGREPRADSAVLLPRFATWDPPGRVEAGALRARGLATARAARATALLVPCGPISEPCSVTTSTGRAERRVVRGIDPRAGWHDVRVQAAGVAATREAPEAWRALLALGRRAVAHQIAGAARAMLDLACAHARQRSQFGRPIARFQAVRHRLADALVAVETLEAALDAAREDASDETAALAKAIAGRAARTVSAQCQQVLAGIGFTAEHPSGRLLERALALEGLFGSADEITLDVGRRLLAERRVPTLIEL